MFKNFMRGITSTNDLETDVAQAVNAATDGTTQILDVREPEEWAGGHIPGAILIPLGQLQQKQRKLDSTRPVIIVCRSGNRSLVAAKMLKASGFEDVKSLAGGMIAWAAAGQRVKR